MKKKTTTLNREQILKKLSGTTILNVDIPGIGVVDLQTPDLQKVLEFASEHKEIGEKSLNFALALMAIKELSADDVLALATNNNGFAVCAAVEAINRALGLTDEAVGKQNKS